VSDVLVDDRLLGALLREEMVRGLPQQATVHTTGYWYVRMCRAYFAGDTPGSLSGPFRGLSHDRRVKAQARVLELPQHIGLIDLRTLAPSMGRLWREHPRLNLLAIEVLAAASSIGADVFAGARSPELEAALSGVGLRYVILGPR
jgi:hypothetical protein